MIKLKFAQANEFLLFQSRNDKFLAGSQQK